MKLFAGPTDNFAISAANQLRLHAIHARSARGDCPNDHPPKRRCEFE